jgi:DNA-directed RNA polymerase specialized sigma24 family protein
VDHLIKAQAAFKEFVRWRVPNREVADDLLQLSLVKAIEAIPDLRNEESIVPWFYRLLRPAIVDYYRSHAADDRKHQAFLRELTTFEGRPSPWSWRSAGRDIKPNWQLLADRPLMNKPRRIRHKSESIANCAEKRC